MPIDRRVWPFLLLIGVTTSTAYIDVEEDTLHVRLGLFRYRFSRAAIVSAQRATVNWTYGIGIHTNAVNTLVINSSLSGLVELQFDPAPRTWVLVIPVSCRRLFLSPLDPDGLIAALNGAAPAG
ncbi:MAG: hypothetical protein IT305_19045 [Chloroflexi bacterium]|nr:hypothetical protein [Chloroflexota bacterium]